MSSIVILLGAELNSEVEHQTARDFDHGAASSSRTEKWGQADPSGHIKPE